MIEGVVFAALRSLVSNRVYPNTFPQPPELPVWPAIRYSVISSDNEESICGTDDVSTDDTQVQLDIVARTHGGATTLRDQVIQNMQCLDPPAVRMSGGFQSYDAETKTHRVVLDFMFQASSS